MKTIYILLALSLSGAASTTLAQTIRKDTKCVQGAGKVELVSTNYNTKTGEWTVTRGGKEVDFDVAYPLDSTLYIARRSWYIANEAIAVKGGTYVKYGLPRILGPTDVARTTTYKGITVYAEDPKEAKPQVIYLPVRTDCEFQPYRLKED